MYGKDNTTYVRYMCMSWCIHYHTWQSTFTCEARRGKEDQPYRNHESQCAVSHQHWGGMTRLPVSLPHDWHVLRDGVTSGDEPLICPSPQDRIAVKLPDCSRGAPYPFPGSHWLHWAGARQCCAYTETCYSRNSCSWSRRASLGFREWAFFPSLLSRLLSK
jgi:hypothetical protein